MRIDIIEVQNFFNHKYTKVDLRKTPAPILAKGENGSGKTSLFVEALTFAIFGVTRNSNVDDSIRGNANQMGVSISFGLNGQEIEIIRTKKRGKSASLELVIDGVKTNELLTETQKRIDKLFGLSYNSFLSTAILKQEDADFFVRQKPDERKKIIGEILDLNQYERLEKIANEQRRNLKAEIKIEENIYNSINLKDIDEIQSRLIQSKEYFDYECNLLQKRQEKLNSIQKENMLIDSQLSRKQEVLLHNSRIEQMIQTLEKQLKDESSKIETTKSVVITSNDQSESIIKLENIISEAEKLLRVSEDYVQNNLQNKIDLHKEDFINLASNLIDRLETSRKKDLEKLNDSRAELRTSETLLKKLQDVTFTECPTCLQEVDHKKHNIILQSVKKTIEDINARIIEQEVPVARIQQIIDAVRKGEHLELEEHKVKLKELSEELSEKKLDITNKKIKIDELRTILKNKSSLQTQYEAAKREINYLNNSINEKIENITKLKEALQDVPVVIGEKISTEKEEKDVNTSREKVDKLIRYITQVESEFEQALESKSKKEELEENLKVKIHKINLLDKICIAFSRKGIPAAIISTVLPEIEETTNYFLSKISHGQLAISFKTTEVNKKGDEKDTLDIEVHDGKIWRSFESFSGGEKFRVSLSIRLALSKVLARRAGIELELLILDEPASALDPDGRQVFVNTIKSIASDFSRLIIMTHLPDLASEFENAVVLTKSEDGTKILGE